MQCLRHPQAEPDGENKRQGEHACKQHLPLSKEQKQSADGRREHRHDDEYGKGDRQHAGHLSACIAVPHDGDGENTRSRCPHSLNHTRQQKELEARRSNRHAAADGIHGKADHEGGATSEYV
jgi:hypothetical protein